MLIIATIWLNGAVSFPYTRGDCKDVDREYGWIWSIHSPALLPSVRGKDEGMMFSIQETSQWHVDERLRLSIDLHALLC